MLKRPSVADTEEDLLAFQQSFLASGSKPAASVAARSRVGEKRKQLQQGEHSGERERDVVRLQSEELPSIDAAKPPAKKSKFKVQREKSREKNEQGFKEPFEAMERHDRHITKVLSDIQEHDSFSLPACLPARLTKHGFPTVHELDLKAVSKAEDTTEGSSGRKKQAKKSLFAQQFESHGPEYFGLELQTQVHVAESSVRRDVVQPVNFAGRREEKDTTLGSEESKQTWFKRSENVGRTISEGLEMVSHERICGTEKDGRGAVGKVMEEESLQEGMEVDGTPAQGRSGGGTHELPSSLGRHPGGKGDPLVKEEFASEASRTWGRFLQSGVISGEGLTSVGVAPGRAQEEVGKIHEENVERLSRLTEGEILEEQDKIRQLLGPDLVSFLQSRQVKQKMRGGREDEERGGRDGDERGGSVEEEEGNETQGGITAALEDEGGEGDGEEVEREEMKPLGWSAGNNQEGAPDGRGWLHMEVLEKDKMQWMTDVSLHSQPGEGLASKEVRFSLEGLVIPRGAVIPSHLGLHHHGEEPEAAGYTLNELLHLSRSRVLQQRVLSLQILTRIIQRSRQNEYGCLVEGSVLGILLEAGVPTMLRYALDDSADTVMAATILCLHGLLVIPVEEYLMDKYCYCFHGNTLPALRSHDLKKKEQEEEEKEEEKESDTEIIQRDVVEGYLQMKLPHRLRYILEVCLPPSSTTVLILELLTRLCRHSVLAASKVLHCPRLMTVVFEEFLPLAWSEDQDSAQAHGRPHSAAMKLVQTICTAGRNLTAHLVSQHKLMAVVTRYTLLHPSELSLKEEEAYDLCIASLRTWNVALGYGIGADVMSDPLSSVLDKCINTLSLKDPPHPITTSLSTPSPSTPALLTESQILLPSFRSVYLQVVEKAGVCLKQRLSKSRAWLLVHPLATKTQQLPPYCGPLLPLDWPLLPIIMEYNSSVRSDSVEPSSDVVSMVTHTLHFLLLLELLRPHVLSEFPPGSRLARILCTFLIGNDLFLERRVHSCLSALLAVYCREEVQRSLDFDLPIPGLDSFQDLYTSLLSQYMAVSYGDALFSCFLLLPLQQRFAPQLRKVVWGNHPSILRLLTLPVTQVPLKAENFLYPLETDGALLEMYMTAIATATVRPERNPFLYLVAVHHVHSFIFKQSEVPAPLTTLQEKLLQGVLQLKDENSKKHLLLYSGPGEESRLGFQVASTLTDFQRSRVVAMLQDTRKPSDIPGLL